MIDMCDDRQITELLALSAWRDPVDAAYRIRSGGNSPISTFLFFTPCSALEARHIELVANVRPVGSLRVLEVIRAEEEDEVVASARLFSDIGLALATSRCRHASQIRFGVTLAPRII